VKGSSAERFDYLLFILSENEIHAQKAATRIEIRFSDKLPRLHIGLYTNRIVLVAEMEIWTPPTAYLL
jgi:hypothetical protein